MLYRRVLDGFRSIESGLIEIERRRRGTETVTLSLSSAFTTHWLMPRMDKLQRSFPNVDLRFQADIRVAAKARSRTWIWACGFAIRTTLIPTARW